MLRSVVSRVSSLLILLAAAATLCSPVAVRADDGPIIVFPLASSVADVPAAQTVTNLVAQRIRFVYGDRVKVVTDFGSETLGAIVKRVGAQYYVGGTLEKSTAGYSVDLQGR